MYLEMICLDVMFKTLDLDNDRLLKNIYGAVDA